MSSSESDQAEPADFAPFTKAQRIQQLNDIDKSITQLLQSAGLALQTLSSTQTSDASNSERKEAFQSSSNAYLATLQKVDVVLRRQIYGLEEANIIPAEKAKRKDGGQTGDATSLKPNPSSDAVGGDGMGKLDIGWLNSRSGRVGRDMEAELWRKSREFLEKQQGGATGQTEEEEHEEDTSMAV